MVNYYYVHHCSSFILSSLSENPFLNPCNSDVWSSYSPEKVSILSNMLRSEYLVCRKYTARVPLNLVKVSACAVIVPDNNKRNYLTTTETTTEISYLPPTSFECSE